MKDFEGNEIKLRAEPNLHMLVWGQSGQGKTYYCCRKIEEAVQEGKRCLILDFSGSYSEKELKKNQVTKQEHIQIFNPRKHPFYFFIQITEKEKFIADLADALSNVLGIKSYYQEKWMRKAVAIHVNNYKDFAINQFVGTLERIFIDLKMGGKPKEDIENISHLLSRLSPYANIDNLHFHKAIEIKPPRKKISIVQLSDFSEKEKKFLTELLITMFWKERINGETKFGFDVLLLDEFQFLSLKGGKALASMLREGRKYELQLLMSSQFINNYADEELETLLQAGHCLIFRPTARDQTFSAKIIDSQQVSVWRKILSGLKRGEAVLVGSYSLSGRKTIITEPLCVRI